MPRTAKLLYIDTNRDICMGPNVGDRFPVSRFVHVADIETTKTTYLGASDVWDIAQNLDWRECPHWINDPKVTVTEEGDVIRANVVGRRNNHLSPDEKVTVADVGLRSAMVGDIVNVGYEYWICRGIGWGKLQAVGGEYVVTGTTPSGGTDK